MTKVEFIRESGYNAVRAGNEVVPCNCDEPVCPKWQIVPMLPDDDQKKTLDTARECAIL